MLYPHIALLKRLSGLDFKVPVSRIQPISSTHLGGLIGLATSNNNGLMSKIAFSSTNVYSINNYALYKLFTLNEDYIRKFAVVEYGSGEQNHYAIVSGYYSPNSGLTFKLHTLFNTAAFLKFYYKDKSVFLLSNQTGSTAKAFIRSVDVIEMTQQGSSDMSSYTEIKP